MQQMQEMPMHQSMQQMPNQHMQQMPNQHMQQMPMQQMQPMPMQQVGQMPNQQIQQMPMQMQQMPMQPMGMQMQPMGGCGCGCRPQLMGRPGYQTPKVRGILNEWNDQKACGFIQTKDGMRFFCHKSAFFEQFLDG